MPPGEPTDEGGIPVCIMEDVSVTGMPYWFRDELEEVECDRTLGRSMVESPDKDLERDGMGLHDRDSEDMLLLLG